MSEGRDACPETPPPPASGGVIHTYLGYDPKNFPMPAAKAPDLVTPAFEHMLEFGNLRDFTEEELAGAIEIDPSQIQGLGPSLSSLLAMLEERKRRILETYEVRGVREAATTRFRESAAQAVPTDDLRKKYERAVREEQIADLERLWYAAEKTSKSRNVEKSKREASKHGDPKREDADSFAAQLLRLIERLGEKYQVEQLAAKYAFTGRQSMTVPEALEIKEELETIDRLIAQLKDAAKNAKLYLVNMEELARFADEAQLDGLERLRRQVDEMIRHLAEEQGLRQKGDRYQLTPKAMKLFQSKLLDRIFSELQAARTGRHAVPITGDGSVELQRTKPYEFGDSLANMDVPATLINAMIRERTGQPGSGVRSADFGGDAASGNNPNPAIRDQKSPRLRLRPEDIEIHQTRNSPRCATVVCMDMSGSMRWGGAYINVKRMALALNGLIRREYAGDFLDFVEVATLPRRRHISEVPQLLPKPVTIHDPWVRLKADMSDRNLGEGDIPPHFTNLQHGLRLARQMLQVQDTPNRQIILITDGLPTAHFEGHWLYLLYPPDRRTEYFTLKEGLLCRQQGITINLFLLSSWSQSEEDIRFAYRLAEDTKGRVIFVGGRELDRYVVWDYVQRRRTILG